MNKDRIKKLLPFGIFAAFGAIGLGATSLWETSTPSSPSRLDVKPVSTPESAPRLPTPQPIQSQSAPAMPIAQTQPAPARPMPQPVQSQPAPAIPMPQPVQSQPAPAIPTPQTVSPASEPAGMPGSAQPVAAPTEPPLSSTPPDAQVLQDIEFLTTKLDETLDLLQETQNVIEGLKQQVAANEKRLAELENKLQSPSAQTVGRRYVVQPGDTIKNIATRYGIKWQNLVRWNGICDPDQIEVGTTLRLTAPQTLPKLKCQPVRKRHAPTRIHHNWRLIGISDGRAVIQAADGSTTRLVAVGQRDPDLGKVLLIDAERRLVKTSRGIIRAE